MTVEQTIESQLLRHAAVVLPDRVLNDAAVLIEDGRIRKIFVDSVDVPSVDSVHDLTGLTLYPGMIDLHIHGAVGVDTMSATKADLARVAHFLAANGVTAWLPTLVPAPASDYEKAISAIDLLMADHDAQPTSQGARVLGVHYEGPFVNASQCGALHAAHFKSFASVADIDALPTPSAPRAVRMMTLAPEVAGGIELTKALVSRGWVVSVGHTRAEVEQLEMAFAAGARHMTHLMNAMTPLHHRAPGAVGWGLTKHDVTCDVIADGIHIDPLVLKLLLRAKGADRLMLISDAIAAAGKGDGEYQIWGETISVRDGRTSNAKGSIAGSVITMLDAARLMRSLGAPEIEIARMASTNPARLLGLDRECGAIEVGKCADFVGLDHEGHVRFSMLRGSDVRT